MDTECLWYSKHCTHWSRRVRRGGTLSGWISREIASGTEQTARRTQLCCVLWCMWSTHTNLAISNLQTTLPWVPPDTKLSKLDTLRLASSYIAHLKQILDHEESMQAAGFIHPLNLVSCMLCCCCCCYLHRGGVGSLLSCPVAASLVMSSCHGVLLVPVSWK